MTYYAREHTDPAGGALTITTDHQGVWITATEGRDEVTVGPFPATTLADDMDGGVTAARVEQEPRGHDYTPCTHETDSEHWQARWQEAAVQRDARDAAAHLWKETTRNLARQLGKARTNATYWANTSAAQTGTIERWQDRAEKAEQERDEMLTERDAWEERLTSLVYSLATVEEVGEWSSGNELDQALIDHMQGKIQRLERSADQPCPLTPDAITDDALDRAQEAWETAHMCEDVRVTLRRALAAALTEPTRPEELVALIDTIREATYDPEPEATGEALFNAGVRVTGAES